MYLKASPMAETPVAQADEVDELGPLSPNLIATFADGMFVRTCNIVNLFKELNP
jgi:hypothetical protein